MTTCGDYADYEFAEPVRAPRRRRFPAVLARAIRGELQLGKDGRPAKIPWTHCGHLWVWSFSAPDPGRHDAPPMNVRIVTDGKTVQAMAGRRTWTGLLPEELRP